MALNTFKCNCLKQLHFKGLKLWPTYNNLDGSNIMLNTLRFIYCAAFCCPNTLGGFIFRLNLSFKLKF